MFKSHPHVNTGSPRTHQFDYDTNLIWPITYFTAMFFNKPKICYLHSKICFTDTMGLLKLAMFEST